MKIQSFSDVITNSSSELYVFADGKSVEEVATELDEVAPGWRSEYSDPEYVKDTVALETYIDAIIPNWDYEELEKRHCCKVNGIPINDYKYFVICPELNYASLFDKNDSWASNLAKQLGLTPEEAFDDWNEYDPFGPGWTHLSLSEKANDIIRERDKDVVLVWSNDENPDWDRQEKMMTIGERYHLG